MSLVEGTIYKFTVDNGESHNNVIFCRMNPNDATNDWGQKYNQTQDLTWDGSKNLFTPNSIGANGNDTGVWSSYSEPGSSGGSSTVYLKGSFNNWEGTNVFTNGECVVSLSASTTYEFKIQVGDDWYGNTGTIKASETGWTFETNVQDNCKITTTIAGNYTFSWDSNTNKLSVTYPTGGDDDTGDCKTLYLEPTTTHWNKEGARFAAYFYGGGPAETWVDMESSTCNRLFKVAVPNSAYTNVIFVRMNSATSDNNWNNKWNQTSDLSLNQSNNL
jgi:hypothetical protein